MSSTAHKPYRYTIRCDVENCGRLAYGSWVGGFICKSHIDVALIAGVYDGPLPEEPKSLSLMRE